MQRHFYRRGQEHTLTEVEDLVAMRMTIDDAQNPVMPAEHIGEVVTGATRQGTEAEAAADEETAAFRQAGWVFVRPSQDAAAARSAEDMPEEVEELATVYRTEEGQTLVGTDRITVQFVPELDAEEIRAAVDELGLTVVRELRFARNQYELAVPPDRDPLDVANELQERDDTVYAEPTFVEFIGQRFTPDDPAYANQWHLNNDGDGGATAGADISAEDAWDFSLGSAPASR